MAMHTPAGPHSGKVPPLLLHATLLHQLPLHVAAPTPVSSCPAPPMPVHPGHQSQGNCWQQLTGTTQLRVEAHLQHGNDKDGCQSLTAVE